MESFPYTQSYKKIPEFFESIQRAAVPSRVTISVLEKTFDLKSVNDRPLIGILKCLGFIDGNGAPTSKYSDYKNPTIAPSVLGESIKICYEQLYQKDETAHNLSEDQIKGILMSITGKENDNASLIQMTKTYVALKNLASFDTASTVSPEPLQSSVNTSPIPSPVSKDFVLTHTIVLNLPATTDQKVYDTLFKSIRENLL